MIHSWRLTPSGVVVLAAFFALILLGIHMMAQPGLYVGRGPIPAKSPANVRAMGAVFAILGGIITATFTLPIFLLS